MDARTALVELMALGGDVEQAIVLDESSVLASSIGEERAHAFELAVRDLVAVAERLKPGRPAALTHLDARVDDGAVFVVRGERLTVAATTAAEPSGALVAHDLRTVLRQLEGSAETAAADAGA